MAFTSFNADDDGWAMVTFVDIAANTTAKADFDGFAGQ